MSLLDDLLSIDISSVLSARGSITDSVQSEDFQRLLGGQGISQALGTLGSTIDALLEAQDNPGAILQPLMDAVGLLSANIRVEDAGIPEFLRVVREGTQIVSQVFTTVMGNGDFSNFDLGSGTRLGDVLDTVASFASRYSQVGIGDVDGVKGLIAQVDQGFPSNPVELAERALTILLPFNISHITSIRTGLDAIVSAAAVITVDNRLNAGLLASLDRIAVAAHAQDALALSREMNQLRGIRDNTVNSIRGLLRQVTMQLQRMNIEGHIAVIEQAANTFTISPEGALEFMEMLNRQFALVRQLVETATIPDLVPIINKLADDLEALLKENIEKPIDKAVSDLKVWIRDVLGKLNLAYHRGQITKFFHAVASAIRDADVDGPAREARSFLDAIEQTISKLDLAGEIQSALGDVGTTITGTISTISTSLQSIVDGVNGAASAAVSVLEQVADKLEEFQSAIDSITHAVENLGIEQARDQVVAAIGDLREIAESILSVAPLPDALRPAVEEVISQLDAIDVKAVLEPVFNALGSIKIPDSILDPINEVLDEASSKIKNLITDELISQLEAEFKSAIKELEQFDPSKLLSGVTQYFTDAASKIEKLDPRPIVNEIRGPFDEVIKAIDAVHPNRLLQPVIEAYEEIFKGIKMADPQASLRSMSDTLNSTGEQIGRAVSEPIKNLTGLPEADTSQPSSAETQPTIEQVNPGDVIRLLGYVPRKLKEALAALELGPAGELMARIDSLCGGLAKDLRRVQHLLWEVDARLFEGIEQILKPLGSAQMKAQLAIQANFSIGNAHVDVNASAELLGSISPGCLRAELRSELTATRQQLKTIIGQAGGGRAAAMDRVATIFENCALGRLGNDLAALLNALDPEPLALELDAVARAAINRLPEMLTLLDTGAQVAIQRLLTLIEVFNPVTQGLKFLSVFDILREQLELLNPRRLATELAEIHAAIKATVTAYDPAIFAQEIYDVVSAVAAKIRALDPAALIGDLTMFNDLTAQLQALSPSTALSTIDGALDDVGERLSAIDLEGMLDAVNNLAPKIEDAVEQAGQSVIDNLKALLESIRYFSASASASVSIG